MTDAAARRARAWARRSAWRRRRRSRASGSPKTSPTSSCSSCSDLARFVTGQNIVIDGGMTLHGAGVDGVLDMVRDLVGARLAAVERGVAIVERREHVLRTAELEHLAYVRTRGTHDAERDAVPGEALLDVE